MTIETFRFSPENGYEDTISFPEPASEEATREQLQRLHGQTRDKLNEVISEFNSLTFPTDEHIIELIKGYSPAGVGKVVASDRNYAEVYLWADGNPSQDDRLNRFVTLGADGISIASSDSATIGVSVQKSDVGFIGGYADGDENDGSKAIVSIMGVAHVKTNDNSIVANDFVMSDANGYAVKANYGYRVIRVVSSGLLEIVVSPNTDMIQRIKTDMVSVETDIEGLRTEIQGIGGATCEMLWSNPTPAPIINANIDLTEYKMVIIYIGGSPVTKTYVFPVGWSGRINEGGYSRDCTITTSGVTFGKVTDDMYKLFNPTRIDGIK